MTKTVALLVGLALAGHVVSAGAETDKPRVEQSGEKAGRIAGTMVYTPLKGGFCLLGAGASLFAFLSGGTAAMRTIQQEACTGTWFLTPEILRGEEPLNFLGEIPMP